MSKATAAKLTGLVFLIFIICLPEFFPSSSVYQVQLECLPFDPCGSVSVTGQKCLSRRTDLLCELQLNLIRPEPTIQDWFMCETHTDLHSLHDNNRSLSDMEVEVVFKTNQSVQKLMIDGHFNHSELHIKTHLNLTLLGCCTQTKRGCPSPGEKKDSASHNALCQSGRSQCLFHYVGNNVLKTQTKEAWWWGFSATVWLLLVLVVVILVLLSVCAQLYTSRSCFTKEPVLAPTHQARRFSKRRVKSLGDLPDVSISIWSSEGEELISLKSPNKFSRERLHKSYEEMYKRGLSPIHEVSMTEVSLREDDEEKPDVTITLGSEESLEFLQTASHTQSLPCLHHRSLSSHNDEEEST